MLLFVTKVQYKFLLQNILHFQHMNTIKNLRDSSVKNNDSVLHFVIFLYYEGKIPILEGNTRLLFSFDSNLENCSVSSVWNRLNFVCGFKMSNHSRSFENNYCFNFSNI